MSDRPLRIGNAVRRNNACGRDGAQHRGVALAIACLLLAWPARAAESVTFNKDIAPILFSHCAVCHRDGEVARSRCSRIAMRDCTSDRSPTSLRAA